MVDRGQQVLLHHARHRHRQAELLAGGKHEIHVLEPQPQREGRGLEVGAGDQAAVAVHDRAAEHGAAEQPHQLLGVDATLLTEGQRLRQDLERASDHEIAGKLGQGRLLGRRHREGRLTDGGEDRRQPLERGWSSTRHNKELGRRGQIGPAKDGRSDVFLAARRMRCGEFAHDRE